MMQRRRSALFVIGWASLIGSILDAAIGALVLRAVIRSDAEIDVSVDQFLEDFLGVLYWIKELALRVCPPALVDWLFALPALGYFPARAVLGVVLGRWILGAARRL